MPHSWHPSNTTTMWSGSDTRENIQPNWSDISIDYRFNDYGFRTHGLKPLLSQKVDVALGCSFTEGVGLPIESVWPSLIEQDRPYPMLNLGIGGASTDTVARILTNISGLYNIQTVFILWPEASRFEQYFPDFAESPILSITPGLASIEHVWYMDQINAQQRFLRNQTIVQLLSDVHNFQVIDQTLDAATKTIPFEPARDGCHWGFKPNQIMAELFLNKLT